MEIKKNFLLPLISLIFIFGFLGVVSAEITGVDITSPTSGSYISGIKTITWSLTGIDEAGDRYNADYSSDGITWISINNLPLAPGSTSINWDTDSISDGNYQIRVQHFNLGFQNEDVVIGLTVDNTNPTVTISDVSESWTNSDEIMLSCSDNIVCSTTRWYYFNENDACSSSSADYTNSIEGSNLVVSITHNDYLCLGVKDKAGNFGYTETGSRLYVDGDNPTASLTVSPAGLTNKDTVTYTPTCYDTGGSELVSCTTYVKFNGESPSIISTLQTENQEDTMNNDGTYTFYTVAEDDAGNSIMSSEYNVERDKTAPIIEITNEVTTTWNVGSSVDVETSCSDENSCIQTKYYYSDTSLTCSNINYEDYIDNNAATEPYVCAAAKDNAGNIGYSSVAHFKISATIQGAITNANPGDTINVAEGVYYEDCLSISTNEISIMGAGTSLVTIDGSNCITSGSGQFLNIAADNILLQGLTIDGGLSHYTSWPPKYPFYGIYISGAHPTTTLTDLVVKKFGKSGINLNGVSDVIIDNVESKDNGGAGFFILDSHNINLNSISTSNNQWGGVSIATWGRHHSVGTDGIIFSGTNTFGENEGFQGGLYLEEGNYNDKENPVQISFSTDDSSADVKLVSGDFNYILGGPQDDGDPASYGYKRTRFYNTLEQAKAAGTAVDDALHVIGPGHFLPEGRYIKSLIDNNLYVPSNLGGIQAAIDAAQSGDTVNVYAGTYTENIVIDKSLTVESVSGAKVTVIDALGAEAGVSVDGVATIVFKGFTVENFHKVGVVVKNTDSVQIEDNIITATDHSAAPNGIQIGVDWITPTTGTIKNNEISGCHYNVYDPLTMTYEGEYTGSGILVIAPNSELTISNNEVQNSDVGLDIETGSGTLITNNNVHDNSYGLVFWNADSTVSYNNIYSNALFGVYRTIDGSMEGILDAENNWWETNDESVIATLVSSNVDFEPFAEDNTFTRFYAPVLGAIGHKSVVEGSLLTFTVTASDLDVIDTLTYSENNLPSEASFVDNGDGTASFNWIPVDNDVFDDVEFKVTDGFIEISESITITVTNVAPVVEAGNNQEIDEGGLVTISPTFTDGGSEDTHTTKIDWNDGTVNSLTTHTYTDNGEYTITVTVTDDDGGVGSDTLTVTVNNVAPTITDMSANPVGTVVGDSIEFSATATDDGADDLTFSWDFDDSDGIGEDATGTSTTYSYSSKGTYTVTLTVTDGDGGIDTETLIVPVNDLIWDLQSDWNLVSSPKTLVTEEKSALLPSNAVWEYNSTTNNWITPTQINPGIGYWIDNAPLTSLGLDFAGDCTTPWCLPSGLINIDALQDSWNLIGLTTTEFKSVKDAFSSTIFPNQNLPVFYVIKYDESSDNFEQMTSTDIMNPGEGYWVYMVQ